TVDTVIEELDRARRDIPEAELFVLSEYCFDTPVPPAVCDWCARNRKYLVAGGKKPLNGDEFIDTAFVISPTGETVFEQGKSVPIQFFNDGLPARDQKLWESPWGKIGIAICYDLSYSRVIDRLVELGAQGLIIPTMDAVDWGEHQHWLHAHVAPIRAREYRIPIFRVASSGISQLVDAQGRERVTAPFPGQGERLHGRMLLGATGSRPLDRFLAVPAVIAVGAFVSYLVVCNLRERFKPRSR
ncbi:MAG: hypothetical protein HY290_16255, partial [Planctomycetia bacterium]|nr:hypothetical protein [Planctomycetia bacterium]